MNFLSQFAEIDLLNYTQWFGFLTLVCLVLTLIAFLFKWGIRFRLVGVTSFMGVVTASIFALGLGLVTRTSVPGAVRYTLVFDNAADKVTIAIPQTVGEAEVEATLRQAALDLQPYGRALGQSGQLAIRARTLLHPEPGLSQPLYLGRALRSIRSNVENPIEIELFADNFAQLESVSSEQ